MLEAIFTRIRLAHRNFAEILAAETGLDIVTSERLTDFYLRKKLAKIDAGIGRISVRHGGLLNRDVILRVRDAMDAK